MTEDTYTHRPGNVDGDETDADGAVADREEAVDPAAPVERGREEWDWRGWVLVGVIVLSFLVVPAIILALPPVEPFRFAYLVLPMIPAILLGATAVWSAQRSG
ncbi:hypothetical protein NGM10_11055 [Halorussus salilacus]|uniref:hypothetical protein n=1 Tax=Halorussus salilacus TaxID=2953750 RepID=UPI0020A1EC3A|nr:hypothetical protein [Halorussus salilacus]USZ67267.1 hypothetical protein NGM10_11055 [Halorussus salilacus]